MGWSGIKDYGFGGKHRTKEEDEEYRSRIKGVPKKITWTKDKCVEVLNDCLDILKRVLKEEEKIEQNNPRKLKREYIKDCTILINKILDYMKYLYPPVQQNVNLNIDMTADKVLERIINYKKEQVVVVGKKEEKEEEEEDG